MKDKSRITATESKSVSRRTKCAFQSCRKNKDILNERKIELFCLDTIENGWPILIRVQGQGASRAPDRQTMVMEEVAEENMTVMMMINTFKEGEV